MVQHPDPSLTTAAEDPGGPDPVQAPPDKAEPVRATPDRPDPVEAGAEDTVARWRSAVAAVVAWLRAPPDTVRRGPFVDGAFPSGLRSARLTSLLGLGLAVAFGICFLTGLLSHLIQHPPGWFWWPSRPVGLYRFTQGLHVATGLASVPLLGAKLWSVYPRLFEWPPLAGGIARPGLAVLVGASLFQLVSGILNIARWYAPMPFFFTTGHYWVAWLAIGGLLTHVGVKLPIIAGALRRRIVDGGTTEPRGRPALTRRGLLGAVGVAASVITVGTLGQTVAPLARVSVLAPRRPTTGPQRVPVNKTATGAGVRDAALSPAYRMHVVAAANRIALSAADLAALPQHTVILPIACVEGWSSTGTWSGVRLRDLAGLVGADPDSCDAVVESLEAAGRYRVSTVATPHLRDPRTLIALRLGGEPLALDHGYPARLIAPNRPGVLQTKWISRITLRSTT